MELEQVKGRTWVLKDWELIPLYRIDDRRCVLLDSGLVEQREAMTVALLQAGLIPVGILCSHAHIDHMGNNAYLKETYGTKLAMPLGEAGHQCSYLGLNVPNYILSEQDIQHSPSLQGTPCLADRIILPNEEQIEFCGAIFDIIHTPGHTSDHICVRTPDNVLYLADAVMTGRTLHHSKFPYAFNMKEYLASMGKLRKEEAEFYIAAHYGVYTEILPFIDMEARFLSERMLDLLDLVEEYTTPKLMAAAICRAYEITPETLQDLAYFEAASQSYINYLRDLGYLEATMTDNIIRYRRTPASFDQARHKSNDSLPETGRFR